MSYNIRFTIRVTEFKSKGFKNRLPQILLFNS
jgi:hypothetical protein